MSEYQLLIGGEMVNGDMTMDVINPATEEVVGTCARASKAQLDSAVDAARAAFPAWSATPIAERKALLVKVRQAREHEADVVGALGPSDARTLKRILRKLIEQHALPQSGSAV